MSNKQKSKFPTVDRNASWMSVLIKLGLPTEALERLEAALQKATGSKQGKAEFANNLASLVTSASTPTARKSAARRKKVIAEPSRVLYSVKVKLEELALLQAPEVLAYLQTAPTSMDPKDTNYRVSRLLLAATQDTVVPSGETPDQVAASLFNKLLEGLAQRDKLVKAERKVAAAAAKKANEAAALKALKGLDAKALQALRDNPELLKQV